MLKKSYYTEECYEDTKSFLERATREEKRVKKSYKRYLKLKYNPTQYKLQKGDDAWYKTAKRESRNFFGRMVRKNEK